MNVVSIPITELRVDPNNLRTHGRRNISAIKASLAKFGQQKPIVVDSTNTIIAGNGTFQAAKELGLASLNAIRTTLTGDELVAFAIADNRTAELADWDSAALQLVLDKMSYDLRVASGWSSPEMTEAIDKVAGEAIPNFKPVLDPYGVDNSVTDRDIQRASDSVFSVARDVPRRLPVTCPNCGRDFSIDRHA